MDARKTKVKLQRELGRLTATYFWRGCWVCGSRVGLKTAREAAGPRCRACVDSGRTTPDVERRTEILARLARLNERNG